MLPKHLKESCNVPGQSLRQEGNLGKWYPSIMESFPSVDQLNAFIKAFVEDLTTGWAQATEDEMCCTGGVAFVQGELLQLHPVPRAKQGVGAGSSSAAKDCKAD
ncbi:hypothetical protein PLESTB_000695000 [Pleodorina starrii]|uniref:Uncharacterized protein n=1 Tax=Pleodorina starrii TaxID=330485 RepID=A0A9W6F1N6_9CHLO|nr:hypothetical protein PLESTM_001222000 [Pleodorina starrii]GLC52979.1 hypothetical protein PLESTB_000695000 [Pleodorina starrii]GLC65276.1 hypothetical protein PLESTF_000271400 [Pleodorina starrii]